MDITTTWSKQQYTTQFAVCEIIRQCTVPVHGRRKRNATETENCEKNQCRISSITLYFITFSRQASHVTDRHQFSLREATVIVIYIVFQ